MSVVPIADDVVKKPPPVRFSNMDFEVDDRFVNQDLMVTSVLLNKLFPNSKIPLPPVEDFDTLEQTFTYLEKIPSSFAYLCMICCYVIPRFSEQLDWNTLFTKFNTKFPPPQVEGVPQDLVHSKAETRLRKELCGLNLLLAHPFVDVLYARMGPTENGMIFCCVDYDTQITHRTIDKLVQYAKMFQTKPLSPFHVKLILEAAHADTNWNLVNFSIPFSQGGTNFGGIQYQGIPTTSYIPSATPYVPPHLRYNSLVPSIGGGGRTSVPDSSSLRLSYKFKASYNECSVRIMKSHITPNLMLIDMIRATALAKPQQGTGTLASGLILSFEPKHKVIVVPVPNCTIEISPDILPYTPITSELIFKYRFTDSNDETVVLAPGTTVAYLYFVREDDVHLSFLT